MNEINFIVLQGVLSFEVGNKGLYLCTIVHVFLLLFTHEHVEELRDRVRDWEEDLAENADQRHELRRKVQLIGPGQDRGRQNLPEDQHKSNGEA